MSDTFPARWGEGASVREFRSRIVQVGNPAMSEAMLGI
jgi:hypothetical protein